VTSVQEAGTRLAAIYAGAMGYVLKDVAHAELLVRSVAALLRGERMHDPLTAVTVSAGEARQVAEIRAAYLRALEQLTPQQRVVARLILDGKTNQEIAQELVLSRGPVNSHVSNILQRLNLATRREVKTRVLLNYPARACPATSGHTLTIRRAMMTTDPHEEHALAELPGPDDTVDDLHWANLEIQKAQRQITRGMSELAEGIVSLSLILLELRRPAGGDGRGRHPTSATRPTARRCRRGIVRSSSSWSGRKACATPAPRARSRAPEHRAAAPLHRPERPLRAAAGGAARRAPAAQRAPPDGAGALGRRPDHRRGNYGDRRDAGDLEQLTPARMCSTACRQDTSYFR
jgi:DNA-binding CsgD family transcriptional regulator